MSEQASQEPTMEEILASIRRIISEDDNGGEAAAEPAAEAETDDDDDGAGDIEAVADEPVAEAPDIDEPVAEAEPETDEDDALELTEKVDTVGDLDILASDEAEPEPAPVAEPEPEPVAAATPPPPPVEPLVSEHVADQAASAFGALSAAIAMPHSERTLEDVVRELLRPLLQQWLDQNLPAIVQQTVDAEVERIARGRVR